MEECKQNNLIHTVQKEILQICKRQCVQVVWGESDDQFGMAGYDTFTINPYFVFFGEKYESCPSVTIVHPFVSFWKKHILCKSVLRSEYQFSHQIKILGYPLEKYW